LIPPPKPLGAYLPELGEALVGPAPAEVVDDETLHAGRRGGVDHGGLQGDPARSHGADGGVLALQGGGQVREGVGRPDDGRAGGEGGGGGGAGDDGDGEVGGEEGGGYRGAEVAACLYSPILELGDGVREIWWTYAEHGYFLDGHGGRQVFSWVMRGLDIGIGGLLRSRGQV